VGRVVTKRHTDIMPWMRISEPCFGAHVGLFQSFPAVAGADGAENVMLPRMQGQSDAQAPARTFAAVACGERVEPYTAAANVPGEQQRVAIARRICLNSP